VKKFRDTIVVGFALFAMFLGAGNLIFPPTLGAIAGDKWIGALIGFILTGVGLPVLGVIAASKAGGKSVDVAKHLGEKPAMLLTFMIVICIGPLLAIPRTAAVTYEIGIKPLFPSASPIISAIIFFLITIFFTINSTTVIDKVGSILTPLLLIVLSAIIIVGITMPIGVPVNTGAEQNFLRGFEEGYQTMDALASLVFATIIIQSIADKGYDHLNEKIQITIRAGIISALGLFMVYGGFLYLGATSSGVFSSDLSRAELLIGIVNELLGNTGSVILSIAVSLACLTTAVGLTATAGNFFSQFSSKLTYEMVVYLVCAFSGFFAINGVDTIISLAVPLLTLMYPVTIVLIVLSLFDNFIKYKSVYKGACVGALILSVIQNFLAAEDQINNILENLRYSPFFANMTPESVNFDTPIRIIQSLPLATEGFAWIVPAVVLGFIFMLIEKSKVKSQ
jgi:LIVCS family branched-chain amino acid:cation transporter